MVYHISKVFLRHDLIQKGKKGERLWRNSFYCQQFYFQLPMKPVKSRKQTPRSRKRASIGGVSLSSVWLNVLRLTWKKCISYMAALFKAIHHWRKLMLRRKFGISLELVKVISQYHVLFGRFGFLKKYKMFYCIMGSLWFHTGTTVWIFFVLLYILYCLERNMIV